MRLTEIDVGAAREQDVKNAQVDATAIATRKAPGDIVQGVTKLGNLTPGSSGLYESMSALIEKIDAIKAVLDDLATVSTLVKRPVRFSPGKYRFTHT